MRGIAAKKEPHDAMQVNVNNDYEVRYWTAALGVPKVGREGRPKCNGSAQRAGGGLERTAFMQRDSTGRQSRTRDAAPSSALRHFPVYKGETARC